MEKTLSYYRYFHEKNLSPEFCAWCITKEIHFSMNEKEMYDRMYEYLSENKLFFEYLKWCHDKIDHGYKRELQEEGSEEEEEKHMNKKVKMDDFDKMCVECRTVKTCSYVRNRSEFEMNGKYFCSKCKQCMRKK